MKDDKFIFLSFVLIQKKQKIKKQQAVREKIAVAALQRL